tara:strand:+ start:32544 stop:34154 length:1611 start_codon:yes stop_codon:yes gene_type:complete
MKRYLLSCLLIIGISISSFGQCSFDIQLTDTYGDGWNGGLIDVYVDGVLVHDDITIASGSGPATFALPATPGQDIEVFRVNPGSWPSEMRVEIYSDASTCSPIYGPVEPNSAGSGLIAAVCSSGNPEFAVSGDATSPAPYECVELTEGLNNQAGCAWQKNVELDFASDFVHDMVVYMGSDPNGADGLCFVIHNDPAGECTCGGAGGGIGASGIQNSLIVEIDTYLNFEDRDDGMAGIHCTSTSNPDHMDIWINGDVNPDLDGDCNSTAAGERVIPNAVPFLDNLSNYYEVSNGLNHTLRITWVASTQMFTAELMDEIPGGHVYGTVSYSFDPLTLFGTNEPHFGYTASTGGLSNDHTFCLPPELLPVELDYFNSTCSDEEDLLQWRTLSERDASHFYVRGTDNFEEIEVVSTVQASGNSTEPIDYTSTPSNSYDYYQLVQVDFNGVETEYDWISAKKCATEEPLIYPNPAQSNVSISWNGTDSFSYELRSADGKLILKNTDINSYTKLNLDQLSSGTYLITIYDNFSRFTRRLIVQ